MSYILGIDLGGTSLDFILATHYGDVLLKKGFPSPFKTTNNVLPSGEEEVLIDTILQDTPSFQRVSQYIKNKETEFIARACEKHGDTKISRKGYSICGRVWEKNGCVFAIGGNIPIRFCQNVGNGMFGTLITEFSTHPFIKAANDANAAATAQGIYYEVEENISLRETGYLILGTGFGFGVPTYSLLTEIGHIPVNFVPHEFWQNCGCTLGHKTACAENFTSGRGITNFAKQLLIQEDPKILTQLGALSTPQISDKDFSKMVSSSKLWETSMVDAKQVMTLAHEEQDPLCLFVADIAATITAYSAITAATLFGLRRIGVGESVACENPWHVKNISDKVCEYSHGSNILTPPLRIEISPIRKASRYGALALIIKPEYYRYWIPKMERNEPKALPKP